MFPQLYREMQLILSSSTPRMETTCTIIIIIIDRPRTNSNARVETDAVSLISFETRVSLETRINRQSLIGWNEGRDRKVLFAS